ncbi:PD-(D/E)XK nuclease family protein [Labilibaculum sp. K2S]|uniref:PD-(D/E)XK nuclease family protein n=1 Tax=Labilibaculum sp. K2S TaxID=3056386 RepID=UPI0025A456C6|nr:PD-(D/E)XK nuclease family protein [Labilibaculum sp. K2S]MDM8159469.1 PD-(D/E)XK nuclease family protein [Labilibaculum sp. K2S]
MNSFLRELTSELYEKYGSNLSNCMLVFPNRRAGLFFSKYLNELIEKPVWAPRILTINDFFKTHSQLQTEDNLGLLFRLYKIYIQKMDVSESFDEFYHWGEMLLGDFDDLDKYRVNAKHLFQNLAEEKEIDNLFDYLTEEQIVAIQSFWSSFRPEKYSEHQKEFVKLWENLYPIYSDFRNQLEAEGLAYEGMASRKLVDELESGKITIKEERIIFIGFNALNRCEENLFDELKKQDKADFYWDYDESYLQNPYHEAGLFLRENIKRFPAPKSNIRFDNIKNNQTKVEFVSLSSEVGQAKYAHAVVEEFCRNSEDALEETAIVLADEELLLPVLHSIPKIAKNVNVTMGYPAKNTPVASLLRLVIDLQKSVKKSNGEVSFHHKQVLSLLNHQYLNSVNPELAHSITQDILTTNRIEVPQRLIKGDSVLEKLFSPVSSVEQFSIYLLELLQGIYQKLETTNEEKTLVDKIEQEYIYHLFLAIKRLNSLLNQHKIELKQDTFYKILDKMIQSLSIPFEGEPLAGLQVMGILETRLLDFKKIVVLSMNEGKLPKTGAANSFVPYHLRKGFGMPTIDHQDAIFAYYFYRLIQRVEDLKLLYSTQSDGIRTGEMSRFLYQLKYESDFEIVENSPSYNISLQETKPISVVKNERIQTYLSKYCGDGIKSFSPSALNTYMNCSLSFYFKYLAGLKEPDVVLEEIDPPTFGNLFHSVLEELYKPFSGKTIRKEDLEGLRKNKVLLDQVLKDAFRSIYFQLKKEQPMEIGGRNLLVFDILKKFIDRILILDQKFAPFEIVSLEGKYKIQMPIGENADRKVNISGLIDRVDKLNDTIRILDYKTGKADLIFKDIASLFEKEGKNKNKAAFQTLLYCLFYDENYNPSVAISPGIYSLKEFFNDGFDCTLAQKEGRGNAVRVDDYRMFKAEFVEGLKKLLEEIFNQDIPFYQVENKDICRTCVYAEICHR